MEFVTALLFERPAYLVPVLLVIQFVLVRRWAQRRTSQARRAMLFGFACIPLLLAVQALVQTDREALIAQCRAVAALAEKGDAEGIGHHIAAQFETEGLDRAAIVSRMQKGLKAVHPENVKLSGFDVTFQSGRRATVIFQASARVYGPYEITGRQLSKWELRFERTGGRWQIIFLSPREIVGFPFNSLRELLSAVAGI